MFDLPKPFDLDTRRRVADFFALLMAASLPWSITLFSVVFAMWWPVTLSTLNFRREIAEVARPEYAMPIAVFAMSFAGLLWSEAPLPDQINALVQMLKLIFIPLLIFQFSKTSADAGYRVAGAFLLSCTILMVASWAGWFDPRLALRPPPLTSIPVKNYITQAQEFLLCSFGISIVSFVAWTKRRRLLAALSACIAFAFMLNLALVISSRTVLISIPILLVLILAVLGARTGHWRSLSALLAIAAIGMACLWFFSTTLQTRFASISEELTRYEAVKDLPTTGELDLLSTGQRLVYWRKSLRFIAEAPLFGHGTGSIGSQFAKDSAGKSGAEAITIANPHNQVLHASIQWGALGIALLIAMWLAHLRVFTGTSIAALAGLFIVAQNILSSLFNSHIADFVEGWIYVIGVGVSAGMVRRLQLSAEEIRREEAT